MLKLLDKLEIVALNNFILRENRVHISVNCYTIKISICKMFPFNKEIFVQSYNCIN